jgi:deoxyribonucleoside regulator
MNNIESNKEQFLYKVAKLYYMDKIPQMELAKIYKVSIATISRALKEAEELKIIEIKVNDKAGYIKKLADNIEKKYNLQKVILTYVPYNNEALIKKIIGKSAAVFIAELVEDNTSVGLAWGSTIFEMVKHLEPRKFQNLRVIDLIGSIGKIYSDINASELAKIFGKKLNANVYFLNSLAIVKSKETRDCLLKEDEIKDLLMMAKKLDIAIVSIGSINFDSSLIKGLKISNSFFNDIKIKGAVGDICLRFFDDKGETIKTDFDDRMIGISLEDFRKIKTRVCISGGLEKLSGIKAAISNGLINILITDSIVAENL